MKENEVDGRWWGGERFDGAGFKADSGAAERRWGGERDLVWRTWRARSGAAGEAGRTGGDVDTRGVETARFRGRLRPPSASSRGPAATCHNL